MSAKAIEKIEGYYKSNHYKPFYMAVGDEEYKKTIDLLKTRDVKILHLSGYCGKEDKLPDLDKLREDLKESDASSRRVLLGLGEYLALSGKRKTEEILEEFFQFNLGRPVVLLLRGVASEVKAFAEEDPRRKGCGRVAIGEGLSTSLSFKLYEPGLGLNRIKGIKGILAELEKGETGEIRADTSLSFNDSILPIQRVKDSFEAAREKIGSTTLAREHGGDEMWARLAKDLKESDDIDALLREHVPSNIQYSDYYEWLYEKDEYESWLFYISLRRQMGSNAGGYLEYALKTCGDHESFKSRLLEAIMEIPRADKRFRRFYGERKRLLAGYNGATMNSFIAKNRKDDKESVFRLTDNTPEERREIIVWIAKHSVPENLAEIYPDLAAYLKPYAFSGDGTSDDFARRITRYFEKYKELKIRNKIDEDFSKAVDDLATERIYNRLPNRDKLVKKKNDGATRLCWIDALGAEYLAYIKELAEKRGLKVAVEIGRADLPTITSENKRFFENWPENLRWKVEELDEIKHKEKGGYHFDPNPEKQGFYPVHLEKELSIIRGAVEEVATNLESKEVARVAVASDHGASRLAVLKNQEEKYETDTKGEHSGRCCRYFEDCDIPSAIKEKDRGYIVLADYGRFKNSRKANVEVHGGASLEEVIVPVITFSLKDQSFKIEVVDPENIKADYKKGVKLELFVTKSVRQELKLGYGGRKYPAKKSDSNRFVVEIPEIKKSGTYSIDVYLDDDLAESLEIKASGKSASMNDDFDNLF